ncbi:xanthine dehydrogenase/oxidase isoform X2 [Neodiprion pinetum]|uniref:xanthine dehydrogenase/oxidase isoform X2 n=1 Tax=Neodiprion pinetum TaxID=441929 RepID=UPI001EDF08B8|nr:xanthine dehydrogenase/oxidase-like isoform X2 [Neodiprion pinetum]
MGGLSSCDSEFQDTVAFTINGVPYTVDESTPSGTSLNVYLREHANLRGTKAMCLEGGCGVCIVAVNIGGNTMAVNSCLVPILICHGWEITTIEGVGNRGSGYHPVQARLAQFNGSQCGYCSPGMVMNMYSLSREKKQPTMKDVENSFGGNICRCTGYRPILDAFKSLASDANLELTQKELCEIKVCSKTEQSCSGSCATIQKSKGIGFRHIIFDNAEFYKVPTVDGLFSIFEKYPDASYVLHGGNTAHGVYRSKKSQLYIDVNDIPDLHRVELTKIGLAFGANLTLTKAMQSFKKYSTYKGFKYLNLLADHIDLIASVPVRNIGTLAGNLMIKHQHHEFPSDIFLILETVGVQLHILENPTDKLSVNLIQFLEMDMRHKLIYSIILPPLESEYEFRSFKIMPRAQNAHAHVNAGFLFKLDEGGKVLEMPNIIIGGIRNDFLHARKTEEYLKGKNLLTNDVFQRAIQVLHNELNPDHILPDYSSEFRKILAEGLFYKIIVPGFQYVLSINPNNVDPRLRSGGMILERGLSTGKQDFDTDRNIWPLNKPLPKLEAIYQTSGEAHYINDIKTMPDEVHCAFVLTDVANGYIEHVDTTEVMKMKGVIAFYDVSDVPGKNVFIPKEAEIFYLPFNEPLFADKEVLYAGQPLGMIVASSNAIANEAVNKVKVIYTGSFEKKAIVSIEDAIASKDDSRISTPVVIPAESRGTDTKYVIKGDFVCGGQYHYTMETQTCVCLPVEDGIDVYTSTQNIDLNQIAIATCLGVPQNSINIRVKRLGGGYGAKISRAAQVACACALACHKLNRPARFVMTLESNMSSIGKRSPSYHEYEVGVDINGKIQYLNVKHWSNSGAIFNESSSPVIAYHCGNCYDTSTWTREGYEVRTDLPTNTYCRAPASTEGIALAENVMEHIARELGKDPMDIRSVNMNPADNCIMNELIEDLKVTADYNMRRKAVESFNRENRWKKKGIAMVPMKYPFTFYGQFNVLVSVYARDGTVAITHGGIECGQGINTKVAQTAAYILGIDLEMISIKPTTNLTSPNNTVTGGSWTSDSCAYATMMACKELIKRLEPIKTELQEPTWKDLVFAAHQKDVDLCARYMFAATKDDVKPYAIWGCAVGEVEVDLLTGQHVVTRVDLMVDAGISMSPEVDIGQAEGAFIMGLGYWTSEDLIYDPETGVLTNNRTWNYKPPGAKDIPIDFRISLRRNAPNPLGVLRAKATGEPSLCTSCVIMFAIRNAINAARADAGNTEKWYDLPAPITTERILLSSLTNKEQMVI